MAEYPATRCSTDARASNLGPYHVQEVCKRAPALSVMATVALSQEIFKSLAMVNLNHHYRTVSPLMDPDRERRRLISFHSRNLRAFQFNPLNLSHSRRGHRLARNRNINQLHSQLLRSNLSSQQRRLRLSELRAFSLSQQSRLRLSELRAFSLSQRNFPVELFQSHPVELLREAQFLYQQAHPGQEHSDERNVSAGRSKSRVRPTNA